MSFFAGENEFNLQWLETGRNRIFKGTMFPICEIISKAALINFDNVLFLQLRITKGSYFTNVINIRAFSVNAMINDLHNAVDKGR